MYNFLINHYCFQSKVTIFAYFNMCNVAHVRQTLNLIIKHIPVGGRVEKKM
jgi:hypothetical protein